jgi:hypothetical protein
MNFKKIIGLFLLIGITACTKENVTVNNNNEPNPAISVVPEISLEDLSATEVMAYEDSLSFLIKYTDGDGDLGDVDADIMSIEVADTRDVDNFIFKYHLSPRAPLDAEITITGTLEIVLQNIILLDTNNEQETTTFKLKIKDRAGNWSNEVETEVITVF